MALMDQIARSNSAVERVKHEWLQSRQKPSPALAAALQNVTNLITRLAAQIHELQRLATACRDQLAPQLDSLHRARKMQGAYAAAGVVAASAKTSPGNGDQVSMQNSGTSIAESAQLTQTALQEHPACLEIGAGVDDSCAVQSSIKEAPRGPREIDGIVNASTVVRDLQAQARHFASSKVSVLIEGESGTGKELIARLIHNCSPRAAHPYVRVNCAALSESLVESELFGHEKGAFTGAVEVRPGRFELANAGTLLLDEVSEMPVQIQAKLLRVLEEEEFERVGGIRTLHCDVRIIATTNRDLEGAVAAGEFRRDLFYRINAVHLHVPPLRQRRDDIGVLASHFFQRYRHEAKTHLQGIGQETLQIMMAYDWPGNVRQLRNAIHRACLLAGGPEICPEDLPPLSESPLRIAEIQGTTLAEMERQAILHTLLEMGGNKTAVAMRLGITTRTLLNKLNKYRALDAA